MKNLTTLVYKRFLLVAAAAALALLTGCDGESRPFTEAAEVQSLQLRGLNPLPPAGSLDTIYLNPGERLQLGLEGVTESGTTVTVDSSDRKWASTDAQVLVVDSNGLVTAVADGTAQAFVVLGGIASTGFTINVSTATLAAINPIQGNSVVERCIPQNYTATGNFSDGTNRQLQGVSWTANDESVDVVFNDADGGTVTAIDTGAFQITATLDGVSATSALTVADSLRDIEVGPITGTVGVSATRSYEATGTYDVIDEQGAAVVPAATRNVLITDAVQWSVTAGTGNASIGNASSNKGIVTGLSAGTATIAASCGVDSDPLSITIVDNSSDSDNLSFNFNGSVLTLSGAQEFRLSVSTGTSYNSANDVTQDVIWSDNHTGPLTPPIALPLVAQNDVVVIRANATGTIIISATLDGATAQLTVNVEG